MAQRQRAAHTAVVAVVFLALFIHAEYAPLVRAVVLSVTLIVLVVGLYRFGHSRFRPSWPVITYILLWTCVMVWHSTSLEQIGLYVVEGAGYVLFAIALASIGKDRWRVLPAIVGTFIVVELITSVLDVHRGHNNIWPRRDGVTFRQVGLNSIWSALEGRAMGTTGFAITLGIASAVAFICCLFFMASHGRHALLWVAGAAASLYLIVLSGTRTALVMLVFAFIVWIVRSFRLSRIIYYLAFVSVAVIVFAPLRLALAEWFGVGTTLEATASYQHRTGVLDSAGVLFDRDFGSVLFGDGPSLVSDLLSTGAVSGYGDIAVFDNDYLRLFAAYGLVTVVSFIVAIACGVFSRDPLCSVVSTALAVAAFAFDVTSWHSLTILGLCFLVQTVDRQSLTGRADTGSGSVRRQSRSLLSKNTIDNANDK